MRICFMMGHRDAPEALQGQILTAIEELLAEFGAIEFVVGQYGNFDRLAAQAVIRAKARHPEVKLTLLLPYYTADQKLTLPDGFDGSWYPSELEKVPKRLAIVRANRYMAEHSDFLIAYAWHPASNTLKIVEYAQRREKKGAIQVRLLKKEDAER